MSNPNHEMTQAVIFNRQLDLDKVEKLKERVEKLRQENEALKLRHEKSEKDTHEFVAYFQREMEKKDDMIASLNDTLMMNETAFEDERKQTREMFEEKVRELERTTSNTEGGLRKKVKDVEDELLKLEAFREQKGVLEQERQALEMEVKRLQEFHEQKVAQLERKFLEEKAKMQKSMLKQIEEIKQQSREEARSGLDADTRKIVTDNRRMGEELRFQLQASDELQREKNILDGGNKKLKMEVMINQEKEKAYASEGHRQNKEIKQLQAKVKSLERSLSQVVRDFEKDYEARAEMTKKELEEQTLDAAGLRQLVKLKNKELRNIKKLAQTILDQRTDVEQYFLDALDSIKGDIHKERQDEYNRAMVEYKTQFRQASVNGTKFPQIQGKGPQGEMFPGPKSNLPTAPAKRIDLKELTLEDREKVLRLLFAKINSVHSNIDKAPPHNFDQGQIEGAASGGLSDVSQFMTEVPASPEV
jgi:hypothetical protein